MLVPSLLHFKLIVGAHPEAILNSLSKADSHSCLYSLENIIKNKISIIVLNISESIIAGPHARLLQRQNKGITVFTLSRFVLLRHILLTPKIIENFKEKT